MYSVSEYDNNDVRQWFYYDITKAKDKKIKLIGEKLNSFLESTDDFSFEVSTVEKLIDALLDDGETYLVIINKIVFEDEND